MDEPEFGDGSAAEPPEMINAGELVLKRWEPDWADELTAAVQASLPELRRFMPWAGEDYDVAAARTFLEASDEAWRDGTAFNYAVFTTVGELVGSCGLMARVGPGTLEIGYWIHSRHAGRGYATRVARSLAAVGTRLPGIERLVITHDAANPASGRVAAKAGFTEVGRSGREPQTGGASGVQVAWEYRR